MEDGKIVGVFVFIIIYIEDDSEKIAFDYKL